MDKETLYDNGAYRFPAPPVCTARWTRQDWIRYIDATGSWGEWGPEQKAENDRKAVVEFKALHHRA